MKRAMINEFNTRELLKWLVPLNTYKILNYNEMKITKILIIMFLVACIGNSCKDYLNQDSPSIFTDEYYAFNNIDFASKAVYS